MSEGAAEIQSSPQKAPEQKPTQNPPLSRIQRFLDSSRHLSPREMLTRMRNKDFGSEDADPQVSDEVSKQNEEPQCVESAERLDTTQNEQIATPSEESKKVADSENPEPALAIDEYSQPGQGVEEPFTSETEVEQPKVPQKPIPIAEVNTEPWEEPLEFEDIWGGEPVEKGLPGELRLPTERQLFHGTSNDIEGDFKTDNRFNGFFVTPNKMQAKFYAHRYEHYPNANPKILEMKTTRDLRLLDTDAVLTRDQAERLLAIMVDDPQTRQRQMEDLINRGDLTIGAVLAKNHGHYA